jgi:RNA polymerase sigma-70 factor (ECF subfamily)
LIESEFRTAFDEHKDFVYRFVWRMTNSPDAAEDITQDVFLELLHHPGRFDATRGQMRSFLLAIARNLVLKAFRRDKKCWSALDEEQFAAQPVDTAAMRLQMLSAIQSRLCRRSSAKSLSLPIMKTLLWKK